MFTRHAQQAMIRLRVRVASESNGQDWSSATLPRTAASSQEGSKSISSARSSQSAFLRDAEADEAHILAQQCIFGETMLAAGLLDALFATCMQRLIAIFGSRMDMMLDSAENELRIFQILLFPLLTFRQCVLQIYGHCCKHWASTFQARRLGRRRGWLF